MLNDFIRIVQLEEGGLDDVKGDNESLAGLILELNGKFPKAGDIITHENFSFIIESVTPTRIDSIRVIVQPGNHEEE
jgi:CBS domain containing-hemolysin-like protein